MLSVLPGPQLQVLKAMMGRLVTRPDTLSQDLQVVVVLVALVLVLVLLRLGLVAAGHKHSGLRLSQSIPKVLDGP